MAFSYDLLVLGDQSLCLPPCAAPWARRQGSVRPEVGGSRSVAKTDLAAEACGTW